MQSGPITNTADLIHTDDLFSRIKWLEQELNYRCSDEYSEELKALNVWTVGLDASASESYEQVDYTLPTALVVGAEGTGLRRLVRETCDRLVSIPMRGAVSSLNVSVSAGVVLFEAARQRRMARGGPVEP